MECEDSDIQCPCCFETVPKTTTVKCHKCEMESCRACLLDWFKQQQSTTCLACSSMFTQRDVPSLDVTVFKYPFWLPLNKFDGRSYSLHMSCCGNFLDSTGTCPTCRIKYCALCANNHCKSINSCGLTTFSDLTKIAKNCPQCLCYIQKSSGCAEMFCAHCKCSFNWTTGKFLATKAIHSRQNSVFHERKLLEFCKPEFLRAYVRTFVKVFYQKDYAKSLDNGGFVQWSCLVDIERLFSKWFSAFESRIVRANEMVLRLSSQSAIETLSWLNELARVINMTAGDQLEFLAELRHFRAEYREILEFYQLSDPLNFLNNSFFTWQDEVEWTHKDIANFIYSIGFLSKK